MTKKRFAILAAVTNLIAPPFGHIYVGRALRGFIILGAGFGALLLFGWIGAASYLWSFYLVQLFYLAVMLALTIDGVILTRRKNNYESRFYNRWYAYVPFFVTILVVLGTIMAHRGAILGFDNHRMMAMGMAPSLRTGDLIATDTRNDVLGTIPARSDIITFRYPKNPSAMFVKRVLGLPGETISIRSGVVHVNDTPIVESYVTISAKLESYSQSMAEMEIPNDHVFVLGDNRDDSNDSRFWGTLPIDSITGKVTLIWYAGNLSRIKTL